LNGNYVIYSYFIMINYLIKLLKTNKTSINMMPTYSIKLELE